MAQKEFKWVPDLKKGEFYVRRSDEPPCSCEDDDEVNISWELGADKKEKIEVVIPGEKDEQRKPDIDKNGLLCDTLEERKNVPIEDPPEGSGLVTSPWIVRLFTDHPRRANQTYFEHLCHAFQFAWKAGCACTVFILHGIFPFSFTVTGSDWIKELNDELQRKRRLAGI